MQAVVEKSDVAIPPPTLVADFKSAMRQLAAGVVIISADHDGQRSGLTATAACSLSFDPPSMLVCVNKSSHTHDYIVGSGRFRLNALGHQHQEVAEVFAGATKLEGEAKFSHGDWILEDGRPPRLADALVSVDCDVMQTLEVGTHTIFIGEVMSSITAPEHQPLVYADRKFMHLAQ